MFLIENKSLILPTVPPQRFPIMVFYKWAEKENPALSGANNRTGYIHPLI
jgi:hypothetical protein